MHLCYIKLFLDPIFIHLNLSEFNIRIILNFSLGQVIFHDEDRAIVIPYYKICIYAFCLVIPLSIGLLIARFAPRLSKFLVRILKPMALFLILFIMIFGVWANLYIFRLMTWPVFLTVSITSHLEIAR